MQSKTAGSTPGLGTSIIEALAKQLHARVGRAGHPSYLGRAHF
jgi:hypothetical protein